MSDAQLRELRRQAHYDPGARQRLLARLCRLRDPLVDPQPGDVIELDWGNGRERYTRIYRLPPSPYTSRYTVVSPGGVKVPGWDTPASALSRNPKVIKHADE